MKIAVCVPVHRSVPAPFFKCYAELLAYSVWRRHELYLLIEDNGSLEIKRNRLAIAARATEAEFLLWLDDDQTFPPDALHRLLKHDLPVVGCNIATRSEVPQSTALAEGDDQRIQTTEELALAGSIQEVRALGLGLCLMKMDVFDLLDAWASGRGAQKAWPLFDSRVDHLGNVTTGEDVYFCGLIRAAGIPIYVDHALSWEIGHLAQTIKLNAHVAGEKVNADFILSASGDK